MIWRDPHPHVSVAVALEGGWEDLDRSVPAEIKLMDADGRSLLNQLEGGQATANKQDGVSPEDTTPLPLVFNLLGFKFETPGSYTVSVELAGESSGHIPLKLRAVPDSG